LLGLLIDGTYATVTAIGETPVSGTLYANVIWPGIKWKYRMLPGV